MPRKLDFFLDAAAGNVSGAEVVHVWGQNPDVDSGTVPEDVWEQGGAYTFTAAGGATYYISSSNVGDTMDVTVTVLTEDASGDWTEEELTVTVPGQTKTAIVTTSGDDPVRLQSIVNGSGTALLGDLYVYEDSAVVGGVPSDATKIRGKVLIGAPRSYQAIYTIPSSKVGYLYKRACNLANSTATTAELRFGTRADGGDFGIDARITMDNSVQARFPEEFPLPVVLAAKTDLRWRAQVCATNNSAVAAEFDLLLLGP